MYINIYILAITCKWYCLVMRKFPSNRGMQGGSAYPDVTLLITGPAMLSHVLSHLAGLSRSSSMSKQRLHGGGITAKEPKQKGGRLPTQPSFKDLPEQCQAFA